MKISIIGAGRVGKALGRLARYAGYEVADVISRSESSARAAVDFIGAGTPGVAGEANPTPAGVVLICTPDDQIPAAALVLLETLKTAQPESDGNADHFSPNNGPVILHTSGLLSSEALAALRISGASVGSFHPLQTFGSPERAVDTIRQTYFCIEGDVLAVVAAQKLAEQIGAKHFEIPTEMKDLYHAAAVLASGGLASLLSISLEILNRCGLDSVHARNVLMPLVEGTIANVRDLGPAEALTGPARRGDVRTVELNLAALSGENPDWRDIYRLLALRGLQLIDSNTGKGTEDICRLLGS